MCHRALTLAERAIMLDGDDAETVWTWTDTKDPRSGLARGPGASQPGGDRPGLSNGNASPQPGFHSPEPTLQPPRGPGRG
jgi:hypothetical protein